MSQRNLRMSSVLGNTIRFVDPLHPQDYTEFKQMVGTTNDRLNPVGIQRSEMKSVKMNCVPLNSCGVEPVTRNMGSSVTVAISSPLGVSSAAKQQVLDALENVRRSVENGLLSGLKPDVTAGFVVDFEVA